MKIDLTSKEVNALIELIENHKSCSSGCVYPHMQTSKIDCDECEFTLNIYSILNKIS